MSAAYRKPLCQELERVGEVVFLERSFLRRAIWDQASSWLFISGGSHFWQLKGRCVAVDGGCKGKKYKWSHLPCCDILQWGLGSLATQGVTSFLDVTQVSTWVFHRDTVNLVKDLCFFPKWAQLCVCCVGCIHHSGRNYKNNCGIFLCALHNGREAMGTLF